MKYLCGDKDEYLKYLEGKEYWNNQYKDPDGTYIDADSVFYNGLVDFLMAREKLEGGWNYSLHSKYVNGNKHPVGIWVEDTDFPEPILYLRSDQFGFSVPQEEGRAWAEKYPYALFMNLGGEKKFVADCIWDVRTIGGSFLWPLTHEGKKYWKSKYNMYRGVRSYIEDSVDLTLYEIKRFYDFIKENPNVDNQIIIKQLTKEGCLLLKYADGLEMLMWLNNFKNFKGYIDYFCLKPFVDNQYQIIDITKAELAEDEKKGYGYSDGFPVLSKESVNDYRKSKRIATTKNLQKIKQILNNIRIMTIRRTNEMEKIINIYRNK